MSEPSLELQKAIRSRLAATSAVTSLVPATSIVDRNGKPATFPCILIGEAQTVPDDGLSRDRHRVYCDLHIWQAEPGLAQAKAISGAIRAALSDGPLTLSGLALADMAIRSARFLRDPDGLHSHGVISLEARVMEAA